MACNYCRHILVSAGPDKLADKYADFTPSTLYLLNLPSLIFNIFRGEIGKWIAFVAVVLRLFFSETFSMYGISQFIKFVSTPCFEM